MPLTLVVGPPCGGKSTWVEEQRPGPGCVVDFDRIAVELGSLSQHDHPEHIYWRAVREQKHREVQASVSGRGRTEVFVIRTAADRAERTSLARSLGASSIVVCAPSRPVVEERVARLRPARAMAAVDRWYRLNGEQSEDVLRIALKP